MKKLFIDYEKCLECKEECKAECSYFMHPDNDGIITLREMTAFLIACRRCEDYPCVKACPNDALKREKDVVKRANFMCVSCKTCAMACPFGTILPEYLSFLTSGCDYCEGRLNEGEVPLCAKTCPYEAIRLVDEGEIKDRENVHEVGERLLVKAVSWLELNKISK